MAGPRQQQQKQKQEGGTNRLRQLGTARGPPFGPQVSVRRGPAVTSGPPPHGHGQARDGEDGSPPPRPRLHWRPHAPDRVKALVLLGLDPARLRAARVERPSPAAAGDGFGTIRPVGSCNCSGPWALRCLPLVVSGAPSASGLPLVVSCQTTAPERAASPGPPWRKRARPSSQKNLDDDAEVVGSRSRP